MATTTSGNLTSTSVINFERIVTPCSPNDFPTTLTPLYEKTPDFVPLPVVALPVRASPQGLKIGTVDMNGALSRNTTRPRTRRQKSTKRRTPPKKRVDDDRADSYKKALDEINELNQQLDAPALSADAKTAKAKERDEKIPASRRWSARLTSSVDARAPAPGTGVAHARRDRQGNQRRRDGQGKGE